jgi:two-component system response regulator DctR
MQPVQDALVYVVDDDESVRQALAWLLRSRGLQTQCFDSAEGLIAHLGLDHAPQVPCQACCLLLDVRMPGISGLALFDRLIDQGLLAAIPVIFLTGHADVPTAVDAVKRGAFDFCEKPFSDNSLVDRVEQALQRSAQQLHTQQVQKSLAELIDGLTEREREVMHCVVEGLPNKLIADQLHISVRTVEVHRARVFEKMAVRSAVELSNRLRVPG